VRRPNLDGVVVTTAGGGSFEILDPRWWRLDRWLVWFLSLWGRRASGKVLMSTLTDAREVRVRRVGP